MERIKTNNDLRGHGKPGNYGNMCVKLLKGRAFFSNKGGGGWNNKNIENDIKKIFNNFNQTCHKASIGEGNF